MKHLLVLLSGTAVDTSLAHAVALARALDARITLLQTLDQPGPTHQTFIDPFEWQMIKTEAETALHSITERLRADDLRVAEVLLESATVEMILRTLYEHEVDLVIAGLDDRLHDLMQRIRIPVLIVSQGASLPGNLAPTIYGRILVPLDGSQRAEHVLPLAQQLAQATGADLLLAHVVRRPEMLSRAPLTTEEIDLVERVIERNRTEAARYLEQLSARLPVSTTRHLLVSDRVSTALHELAEQEAVDLIVFSAHGYSGEPRWPYGSVATSLINYSARPLMIVQDLPAEQTQTDTPVRETRLSHDTPS